MMTTISMILAEDGEQKGTTDLPESERHRLLADDRRRLVLEVLSGGHDSLAVDDLATEVCRREPGRDETAADDLEAVLITLHHIHLPMLADAGIVEYDRGEGRVEPTVR